MTESRDRLVVMESGELDRLEETLTRARSANDPLVTDMAALLERYRELAEKAGNLSKENQRIKTQLVEMSRSLELANRIDIMTGLANRRDILGKIEQEFSRAERHQRTFSVILADIDDLRLVNEAHGFNAGDELLVEVANVLRVCTRSEDACARWGGEEFLILLPETGIDGAKSVAQKICHAVSMTEFRVNRPGIRITVSIGVSGYHHGQTMFECIDVADQALQQAKRSGKNRFVVLSAADAAATSTDQS